MAQQPSREPTLSRTAWRLSGMGFEFVASVAGFGFFGWLIDRWQGTMPLWTLIGVGLGLIGGGYNFMRQAVKAAREANEDYQRKHPNPQPRSTTYDDEP